MRNKTIRVCVSESERKSYAKCAQALGLTISAWMRMNLNILASKGDQAKEKAR